MKLETKFDYSELNYELDNTVHCLVSATASKVNWENKRTPVNIITAIDVSGSMGGDKIDYTRKSVMKLVDHLGSEDRLSVVLFNESVKIVSEPTLMTQVNKDKFKADIEKLHANGSTNFSGAMTQSLELAGLVKENCRVIIFTDGQPTAGITHVEKILEVLKSNLKANTTVSAFGYGDDHDSTFLTRVAELGKGNYAYIKNPDDALSAFAIELGGLLSCYGQNLVFTITPKDNIKIESVLSDVDVEELDGGAVKISLPDIYSEETKNLVLAIKTQKQTQALPREVTLLDVELKYESTETKKKETETAKAKVKFVKASDVQKDADKDVVNQLALVNIARAQKKAKGFADAGHYDMALGCMRSVNLDGADDNVQAYASTASAWVAGAASYTANRHELSATLSANSRGGRSTSIHTRALYKTTDAQNKMEKAFLADDGNKNGNDTVTILNPNTGHTVTVVSPSPVTVAPPTPTPEKKKLEKKRSDSRW